MKYNECTAQVSNAFEEVVESRTATNHLQWASDFSFLFSVSCLPIDPGFLAQFSGRISLGIKKGWPSLLGGKTLNLNDLELLKKHSSSLLIRDNQQNEETPIDSFIAHAQKLGFRVFQDAETKLLGSPTIQSIEFIEFILSNGRRIYQFPHDSVSSRTLQAIMSAEAVFVLDLIQDFEVLGPFIKQFSSLCQSGKYRVIVSSRVKECHLWGGISSFLSALGVQIIFVKNVFDALVYLPQRSGVLFTASESSASGHSFCYELCRLASPNILKVTFQHGYENIGLRHHISHTTTYQKGIHFASDVIFTWAEKEKLVDAFPSELSRCIPIGVTKKLANDALVVRNKLCRSVIENTMPEILNTNQKTSILLCENLHSVRFKDVKLRESFLSTMNSLHHIPSVELKIRSHPGKRLLEKDDLFNKFSFLTGELTSETLSKFDLVISPPSTIILDSVLCCVNTLAWSANRELGDLHCYDSLFSIKGIEDVIDLLFLSNQKRIDFVLENLAWAARNTAAFDGTRFVLSHIGGLL